MTLDGWHLIANVDQIETPALAFYPERISENIRRTLARVTEPRWLRPHVKTHKCSEVLRLQLRAGITRFKCATLAETEMVLREGAEDVLLAYQPVGANARHFCALLSEFGPHTRLACLVDNDATAAELSALGAAQRLKVPVFIDVDCGQGRTGIKAGADTLALYRRLSQNPQLELCGLHCYDGHIHVTDLEARRKECDACWLALNLAEFDKAGLTPPQIVAGGTPTFPFHAQRAGVQCSPGTNILWDAGYAAHFPDLDFLIAALVLTRVVSKPRPGRLCVDLGHKAIASEGPQPRVILPALHDPKVVMHNEEHLVVEAANADAFPIGSVLYGLPWHICPTVALHAEAVVVKEGRASGKWRIDARHRCY